MSDVTQILRAVHEGDDRAADELMSLVYGELRRMAAFQMSKENPGQTLQPTALVHEAWIRMVGKGNSRFECRGHFFTAAAEAMRRILVEKARKKLALKRGARVEHVELDESLLAESMKSDEMLAVNEALELLDQEDRDAASLVKLRYFVGMTMDEASATMGLSLRAAERLWTYAKAWLRRQMTETGSK